MVVIHYFHILGTCNRPAKADPKLVVDPDTKLTVTVASQCLETVSRRHTEVVETRGDLELPQLSYCHPLDWQKASYPFARSQPSRIAALERSNH